MALVKYLMRDIVLYNDKIIINYYFAEPLKRHTNSIASVIETEKQSREAASLSEIQSSYKGDNSPPAKPTASRWVFHNLRAGISTCRRRSSGKGRREIGAPLREAGCGKCALLGSKRRDG